MTIQTDSLDLNQGFGQSSMQINYTTRRGGNDFHGRLFEDFRNRDLNANSWRNNANGLPRPAFELNEFGVSVGGHVIKDKLFFFGSFSSFQQPGSVPASATVLTRGSTGRQLHVYMHGHSWRLHGNRGHKYGQLVYCGAEL